MDSDVFVKKSFDLFLDNKCFSSIEFTEKLYQESLISGLIDKDGSLLSENSILVPGIAIQAAVIGSVKGNEYIYECMKHYEELPFILENEIEHNTQYVLPNAMAFIARNYGFKYFNKEQSLKNGLKLYPAVYFAGYPDLETKETYAVHCCSGSWRSIPLWKRLKQSVKERLFIAKKIVKKQ